MLTIFVLLTFLFSYCLTAWLRRYALRKNILDIPNHRSSHVLPTPRGGGIAIVISFLVTVLGLTLTHLLPAHAACAIGVGSFAIAVLGYADDRYKLPTIGRFIGHIAAAGWAVYWLQGMPFVTIGSWTVSLPHSGFYLAVVAIVWCTNLYNFMDGIDGLAGSEGLFVALTASIALWAVGQPHSAVLLLFLAACIAGFTIFNWPPAKIFMGDAGSGFLGYLFAVLALYTANTQQLSLSFWFIVLSVFIADATLTLLNRIRQGKKWYAAHREHAYQTLTTRLGLHTRVTLSIVALNMLVVLPLAWLAVLQPWQTVWVMAGLYMALYVIWFSIKFVNGKEVSL